MGGGLSRRLFCCLGWIAPRAFLSAGKLFEATDFPLPARRVRLGSLPERARPVRQPSEGAPLGEIS